MGPITSDPLEVRSEQVASRWLSPVQAEIVDVFRPPATPYGPGNRGLEFSVRRGTRISAVDAGVVSFAGQVGGAWHIVVDHDDGLRSTYSHLSAIEVERGDLIDVGQLLGATLDRFHLSARLADSHSYPDLPTWGVRRYVDPLPLLGLALTVQLVANP